MYAQRVEVAPSHLSLLVQDVVRHKSESDGPMNSRTKGRVNGQRDDQVGRGCRTSRGKRLSGDFAPSDKICHINQSVKKKLF